MNTRTIPIWAFHTTLWSQINYLVVVKNLDFKRFLYISLQSGQLLQGPDAKTATKTPFSLLVIYLIVNVLGNLHYKNAVSIQVGPALSIVVCCFFIDPIHKITCTYYWPVAHTHTFTVFIFILCCIFNIVFYFLISFFQHAHTLLFYFYLFILFL